MNAGKQERTISDRRTSRERMPAASEGRPLHRPVGSESADGPHDSDDVARLDRDIVLRLRIAARGERRRFVLVAMPTTRCTTSW